jgi:hypothetical protein
MPTESFKDVFFDDLFLLIRFIIPLSFTIYIFAYRERKEIAYSTLKRTNNVLNFTYLALSGVLILAYIENKYLKAFVSLHDSNLYFLIIVIITAVWFITLIILYVKLLNSINLFKVSRRNFHLFEKKLIQLEKTLDKFKKTLQNEEVSLAHQCIYYSPKIKRKLVSMLLNLEIVYQILISKLKYNLEIDFLDSNKNFNQQAIKYVRKLNSEYFEELVLVAHDEFLKIYTLILNKNLFLLRHSVNTSSTSDINLIIDSFKDLTPSKFQFNAGPAVINEIKEYSKFKQYLEHHYEKSEIYLLEYYKHVYEMMTILGLSRNMDLMKVLKLMYDQEEQSNLHIKFMDLAALSLALMLYAIERNNVKFLTDLTNILLNSTLKDLRASQEINQSKVSFNGFEIKDNFIDNPSQDEYDKKIETITLMAILLIIKSIELGHYQCAGFLIKVICKRIKPIIINSILILINELLEQQEVIRIEIFENEELNLKILEELNVEFYFSNVSMKYCYHKSVFLILAQQHYLYSLNQLECDPEDILDIKVLIFDSDFIKYLKIKVEDLYKEYGLAYLKIKEFLNDFINDAEEEKKVQESEKIPVQQQ